MIPSFQEMENVDSNLLRDILAGLAASSDDAKGWFSDVVSDSDLPPKFKQSIRGIWRGNAPSDASRLINYAYSRGVQPGKTKFTALGALLKTVLESDIGLEFAQFIAALIVKYGMFRDPSLLNQLRQRYGIPEPLGKTEERGGVSGSWLGPEPVADDVELQSFFQPKLDFFDAGFLQRGMQCAGSVCRIEIPVGKPIGTGFLVTEDKLLTNFHVVEMRDSDSLEDNVRNAVLRFRSVSAPNGKEAEGQIFRLVGPTSVLRSSPANQLDFALLQVEPAIKSRTDIGKAPLSIEVPCRGMPLNILQHPRGGPLSFAFSKDGVRDVFEERGLMQYVTPASGGSSGSPCFNDDWKVVALHHAERSRSFGSIREGVLMNKIYREIGPYIE
jgi:V8-like Glu-specific endopeptidase